jgi:ATP-binding cassette subfamily B (MDR/TAP) protein 1
MFQKYTKLESDANDQTGTIAYEILSSIRTVITFGIQKKAINIYSEKLKIVEKCGIKKGMFRGIFEGIFMGLVYFSYGVGLV